METKNQKSILEMANGAFLEHVDYEIPKIIANIQDVNTNPTKERSLTVVMKFKSDADRKQINVEVTTNPPKLAPTNPVSTTLYLSGEGNKAQAVEMVPAIPGQKDFAGKEQAEPPILHMVKNEA